MKKLLWFAVGVLSLVHAQVFSATLNFDNNSSLPALKARVLTAVSFSVTLLLCLPVET
jgi:hypothetical protein